MKIPKVSIQESSQENNSSNPFVKWFLIAFLLLMIVLVILINIPESKASKLVSCMKDKNVVLYGNSNDENTKEQLSLFGSSSKKLNYIDCSLENNVPNQTICSNEVIKNKNVYWKFDNERYWKGVIDLNSLNIEEKCYK